MLCLLLVPYFFITIKQIENFEISSFTKKKVSVMSKNSGALWFLANVTQTRQNSVFLFLSVCRGQFSVVD